MLEVGYQYVNEKYIYQELRCSYCGEHLGSYEHYLETKEVIDSTERWNFCPYCGESLQQI